MPSCIFIAKTFYSSPLKDHNIKRIIKDHKNHKDQKIKRIQRITKVSQFLVAKVFER